jgi:signal transduction histidine kinase
MGGEAIERADISRARTRRWSSASSAATPEKACAPCALYGELLEEALAAAISMAHAGMHERLELPRLIDGMLEFSRSAYARVSLSHNPLSEIVQAAATMHAPDLEAAHGKVTLESDAVLECDSTLMTSLFQNLFANAIKNRRQDRRLAIRVSCQREPEFWRIAVEDNGSGFEQQLLPSPSIHSRAGFSAGRWDWPGGLPHHRPEPWRRDPDRPGLPDRGAN